MNEKFANLSATCHQRLESIVFKGFSGWWQMGGRWQQNGKSGLFSHHEVLRIALCLTFLQLWDAREPTSENGEG